MLLELSRRSSSEGFAVLRSESIHGQAATIFACWGELFKIFVASGGAPQAGKALSKINVIHSFGDFLR